MSQTMSTDEATLRKIKLVRFWTFGILILAFVVETMVPGMVANRNIGLLIQNVWPMWLITFIVCALVFFGYPWWARRK
jgi:hypothetical protein